MNLEKFIAWLNQEYSYSECGWIDNDFFIWINSYSIDDFLNTLTYETEGTPLALECFGNNGEYYFVANISELNGYDADIDLEQMFPKDKFKH